MNQDPSNIPLEDPYDASFAETSRDVQGINNAISVIKVQLEGSNPLALDFHGETIEIDDQEIENMSRALTDQFNLLINAASQGADIGKGYEWLGIGSYLKRKDYDQLIQRQDIGMLGNGFERKSAIMQIDGGYLLTAFYKGLPARQVFVMPEHFSNIIMGMSCTILHHGDYFYEIRNTSQGIGVTITKGPFELNFNKRSWQSNVLSATIHSNGEVGELYYRQTQTLSNGDFLVSHIVNPSNPSGRTINILKPDKVSDKGYVHVTLDNGKWLAQLGQITYENLDSERRVITKTVGTAQIKDIKIPSDLLIDLLKSPDNISYTSSAVVNINKEFESFTFSGRTTKYIPVSIAILKDGVSGISIGNDNYNPNEYTSYYEGEITTVEFYDGRKITFRMEGSLLIDLHLIAS